MAARSTRAAAGGQATPDCRAHCRLRGGIPPRSGKLPRRHATARIFGRRKYRVSSALKPACSTMNRLAPLARASSSNPAYSGPDSRRRSRFAIVLDFRWAKPADKDQQRPPYPETTVRMWQSIVQRYGTYGGVAEFCLRLTSKENGRWTRNTSKAPPTRLKARSKTQLEK